MTQETVTELGPEFMSRKQHLIQRGARWYYNRAWPTDVADKLGRAPFRKSLKTESLTEATRAKPEAEREYWQKVDSARAARGASLDTQPNDAQALSIALSYLQNGFSEMEELLDHERRDPESIALALATAEEIVPNLRRELVEERGGHDARRLARGMACDAGFALPGASLVKYIQRARIAWYEVWAARLVGDYSVRPSDPLFGGALEAPLDALEEDKSAEQRSIRTLEDLFRAFREARWSEMKRAGQSAYLIAFRTLRDVLGESQDIQAIDRARARQVFNAVKRLPKGYGKGKRWEGLDTLGAIERADREGLPRISAATINKVHMGMISSLFGWAVDEGWIAGNPFKGLRVVDKEAPQDKRDGLTEGQIKTVFSASPWLPRNDSPGGRPSRFWFPLIGLYQGLRLGEIAQLKPDAFHQVDGVNLFAVTGDLKTINARRTLPLHPELERLGLLEFAAERARDGSPYLFGEGPDSRGKWGVSEGRWFSRLLKDLGVEGRRMGLHSLRHAFQDALRRAELHQTAIGAQLAGRKPIDPVADFYGGGFSPRQLTEAISKICYPSMPLLSPSA